MKVNTLRVAFAALALVALVAGCSGGGGSDGPTAPPAVSGTGSATIGGSISTGGASGAGASPAAARTAPANPTRGTLSAEGFGAAAAGAGNTAVTAADETGAGVVVTVQGTGISATADGQGRFRLNGVPGGNQLLVFDHAGVTASLLIEGIQPQESIGLDVTVSGSNVEVHSMTRDGGEAETLDPAALSLSVDPDHWNLNYDRSQGTVEAFLRGDGFELIDLDSIEMDGDGDGGPLAAQSASRQGDHVHARFPKNQVLDLLVDPQPGSTHTIVVSFMEEGGTERFELEAQVTIEGDDEEDDGEDDDGEDDDAVELTLDIQPDSWNTNWLGSNGTVSAKIQGSGFDQVDLDSVVMIGTDPAAGELAPQDVSAQGNHVRARFGKSEAFMTLLDGDTGQTHEITIRFTVGGVEMELTDTIRTVGPAL